MHQEEWYEYLRFTKPQRIVIICFICFNIGVKALPHFEWYTKINHSIIELNPKIKETDVVANFVERTSPLKKNIHQRKNNNPKKNKFNKTPKVLENYSEAHKTNQGKEEYFKFDPNHLSEDSIQLLNIPLEVKKNWIKYRNSGGQFYTQKSMTKIFGMSEQDYAYLESRIEMKSKKQKGFKKYSTSKISVNAATSEDWQTIRGIGPYYAKNILKYKESLGGFDNLEQISEVYRLPDSTYEIMLSRLKLDSFKPSFNINLMSQKSLYKHPYISYKQANLIVKYRLQHGNYAKIDDLLNIISIDQSFIDKIKPYFIISIPDDPSKLSSVD